MLEVRDVVVGYGEIEVLRNLSLDVAAGEIVAVLGANGVGKTTLNRTISGLLRPKSGTISFDGMRIDRKSASEIVALGLIQVPEGRKIFPNMTVKENLELGSYRRATARRSENLAKVYSLFPRLKERAGQFAATLSGGEQQMLAIGRGIMADPRLLILDEPSLGLSPLLVEQMFALVKRIASDGLAVMVVEQNVVQSLDIAARAYVLENGAIALSGDAASLANDPALQKAYLGM